MKAIVTGAAGFIGSHVAEILINNGHSVLGIDDLSGGFIENIPKSVIFEKRSVCDGLDDLFQSFQPDTVFHLAAYAAEGLSHHIPVFNYGNNTVATANVLSSAYRAGARHFVFTSSIAAYGHAEAGKAFTEDSVCVPCDPYGVAKLACEHHIRAFAAYYGRPFYTIFRPHNVFGPRQNIADPYRNVVGIFMAKALQQKPMPVFGDGSQTRSFSYINAVAQAIALAPLLERAKNSTFNIGGKEPMSVLKLAEIVSKQMKVKLNLQFLPPRKEVQHAHCSHDLAEDVFASAYANDLDVRSGIAEMAKIVLSQPIPAPTECPAPVEIKDNLPPSWSRS